MLRILRGESCEQLPSQGLGDPFLEVPILKTLYRHVEACKRSWRKHKQVTQGLVPGV